MGLVDIGVKTGDSVQKIGQLEKAFSSLEIRVIGASEAFGKQIIEYNKLEKAQATLDGALNKATTTLTRQDKALKASVAEVKKLEAALAQMNKVASASTASFSTVSKSVAGMAKPLAAAVLRAGS